MGDKFQKVSGYRAHRRDIGTPHNAGTVSNRLHRDDVRISDLSSGVAGRSIPIARGARVAKAGQRFREGGSEQAALFVFQRLFAEWLPNAAADPRNAPGAWLPLTSIMAIMEGRGSRRADDLIAISSSVDGNEYEVNPRALPALIRELRTVSLLAQGAGLAFNPLTQLRVDLKGGRAQLGFSNDVSLLDRALLANLSMPACDPREIRMSGQLHIEGLAAPNIGVFAMGGPLLATAAHEILTALPGITGGEQGWHDMSHERIVDVLINSARGADQLSLAGQVMDGWVERGMIDRAQKAMAMTAYHDRIMLNVELRLQLLAGVEPSFTSVETIDNVIHSLSRALTLKAIPKEWQEAASACRQFMSCDGGETVVREVMYEFLDTHGMEGLSQFSFVILPLVIRESEAHDARENALSAVQAFEHMRFFGPQKYDRTVRWVRSNATNGAARPKAASFGNPGVARSIPRRAAPFLR